MNKVISSNGGVGRTYSPKQNYMYYREFAWNRDRGIRVPILHSFYSLVHRNGVVARQRTTLPFLTRKATSASVRCRLFILPNLWHHLRPSSAAPHQSSTGYAIQRHIWYQTSSGKAPNKTELPVKTRVSVFSLTYRGHIMNSCKMGDVVHRKWTQLNNRLGEVFNKEILTLYPKGTLC